ncbi:Carbonic anhydrase or acetyltransferase, isoleucine patch superfamily [Paracoccus isoporae]|uniref:Carbonic anhydrase or acetyltransferase, isoleucine patch superfamily n=1 Tax=Paracoccus isoporae TaxID=591205 RepID=A0A1G6X7L7_9RHOB|nr:gamma carbonic anhydrase family protein [Paracoccus isoporae]SDD74104.1 Carbonic anhydrase or acetyltransferase, isoleucine patch superfamily [Paracoccus isoporae]
MIWELDGVAPQIAEDAWIAPDAQIMGRVVIEPGASIWWGAVLRGDNDEIRIGRGSNVQDLCCLHTDPGFPLVIGENVTVGHRAMLHGCRIGDGSLIGMGATVLNGASVGSGSLVGAAALISEGKEIPDHVLVMGAPGRVVREIDESGRQDLLNSAARYRDNAARFRGGLKRLD